ncbi:MAG: tetratricopeptide repeat protein [Coriobacteriia bacterium]|nr:tetratricopeptide repeat protein [Coriobacteriia bacterium]
MAQQSKKKSTSNIGPAGKALIVVFAVLMALSLMLPSLSSIFSSSSSSSSSSEQTTDADSSSDSDSSETDYVAKADEKYGAQVATLEEKYASDPVNLATLLNLGKDYMTWGAYVRYFGSTDADTSHANELLSTAVKYYDEYLAIKDSDAVRVDKALCAYYQEDGTSALQQLKELTESSPDYGPAWANLGLVYEASGDDDSAKAAYAKAQETDPNDEYGAKTYATQRLASMESSDETSDSDDSSAADATADTTDDSASSSTGAQGLTDTLSDLTGSSL